MLHDPSIFRTYDVRGTYPNQMNERVAYAAGQAFVHVMGAKRVVVGRDVRASGTSLQEAMIQGITDAGATAINIGVISTEMLYFASGTLDCDGGLTVTASHNPSQWNGFKTVGKGGVPLVREGKLGEVYEFIQSGKKLEEFTKGSVEEVDLLPAYTEYLKKFVPQNLPNLKIVANTNFGANGKVVDRVVKNLPIELIRLNWQEDGTFPKGAPDPMLSSNRKEISERVVSEGADFGTAWDADADRCFFYDEKGRWFHGYYITAFLIDHFLKKEPGSAIVVERRIAKANADAVAAGQGKLIFSLTGHTYFKNAMRTNNAIFGGETSAHYYYRDFFSCDNGMISFLTILGIFADHIRSGKKVSSLLDTYMEKYPISGEINYVTETAKEIIADAVNAYPDAEQDLADGISATYPDWRFNMRMSNTEPILRLNVEATSPQKLAVKQQELQDFITSRGAELKNDNA